MSNFLIQNSKPWYSISLLIIFFGMIPSATYAVTTKENCTTGIYKADYAPSCNVCGFTERFRIGSSFDIVDWFYNIDGGEKIVSSSSV